MTLKIPNSQNSRVKAIRKAFLDRVLESVKAIESGMLGNIQLALDRIRRGNWTQLAVRRELAVLYSTYQSRLQRNLLDLVRDAADFGGQYANRLVQFGVTDAEVIPPSAVKWALKAGSGNTDAAIALIKNRSAGGRRAFSGRLSLSDRLHKMTSRDLKEVTTRTLRAIREGQSLGFASRELTSASAGFAQDLEKVPKLVRNLQRSARRMEGLTGVDLQKDLNALRRYAKRLKPGGRMQSAYSELLQKFEKYDPKKTSGKQLQSALEGFTHQRQRAAAERIIRTESQTAFRQARLDRDVGKPWLVGYKWRLRRGGNIGCICESLNGKLLTPAEARTYAGGGHPNCSCTLEPVYDTEAMMQAPITQAERAWLVG
jgi:hypothetical protein